MPREVIKFKITQPGNDVIAVKNIAIPNGQGFRIRRISVNRGNQLLPLNVPNSITLSVYDVVAQNVYTSDYLNNTVVEMKILNSPVQLTASGVVFTQERSPWEWNAPVGGVLVGGNILQLILSSGSTATQNSMIVFIYGAYEAMSPVQKISALALLR